MGFIGERASDDCGVIENMDATSSAALEIRPNLLYTTETGARWPA